jgi:hypothetical protein
LRSFPLRAGVYEFLWTSEQRLDELQAEAEFMPTLIQPPLSADNAADTVVVPVIKAAPAPRWKEPEPTPAPLPLPELDSDDHVPAKWLSTPKILAISGVVAVLIVIAYLVTSHAPGNPGKPAAGSPHQVQPAAAPTQEAAPAHQPSSNPLVTPTSGDAAGSGTVPTPPKPPKPLPDADRGIPSQSAASKPTARGHNCSIEGEIPTYLDLAERNRNRGNYEHAISEYNQVLACEPGNRQAQTGLRNAEEAEKYSH